MLLDYSNHIRVSDKILFAFGIKDMDEPRIKGQVNYRMPCKGIEIRIRSGYYRYDILAAGIEMQMHFTAHKLGNIYLRSYAAVPEVHMDGANADSNSPIFDACGRKGCVLFGGKIEPVTHYIYAVSVTMVHKTAIFEEIHLRSADKARNEQVCRMIEYLLRRTDLLNKAILHDYNPVAEGHCFDLIVGDIYEGGINLLAELNELCTHLVAELCIKV